MKIDESDHEGFLNDLLAGKEESRMNMIKTFVRQGILDNPEAAAKEVVEIIETYATDNTKLNRVKDFAKALLHQIEICHPVDDHGHKFDMNRAVINLRQAVADAEGGG